MFLRVRLGQFRIGLRIEQLPHSLIIRFLFSKVADTAGVLNKFANTTMQTLFMDFDDRANLIEIKDKIMKMQNRYNVGDILILQSSERHYVGVCFDLLTPDEVREMMNYLSPIMDYRFTYVYSRDGYNALRIVPKIVDNKQLRPMKLIDIIMSNNVRPKHGGLLELFAQVFNNIPRWYLLDTDGSTKDTLYIREYETINW